jgi:hypothetical protein
MVKKKLPPSPSPSKSSAPPSKSSAPPSKSAALPSKSTAAPTKSAASPSKSTATASKSPAPPAKSPLTQSKPAPPMAKLRRSGTARIVKKGGPAPHVLFIVATDQLRVYQHLEQEIAKLKNVELITDRRRKPRRQRELTIAMERRNDDRRKRPDVEKQLRQLGWSLVRTVKIPPS